MHIDHTMIRVGNLEKSIEFYTNVLEMKLLRKQEYPEGRFTLAFVGYNTHPAIELTYNWDQTSYEQGNAFGHIAIVTDDIYKTCEKISERGGEIVRAPGPMKHGKTVIAFVKDPDGYKIELIERK